MITRQQAEAMNREQMEKNTKRVIISDFFALGLDADLMTWRLENILAELIWNDGDQSEEAQAVRSLIAKVKDLEERIKAVRGFLDAKN